MSRIITVFGATGQQGISISSFRQCKSWLIDWHLHIGGSVVSAILSDGTFAVRAATRNPDSDASKKLKERGVEVVKADLSDKESVKAAVAGSEGVFGVCDSSFSLIYPTEFERITGHRAQHDRFGY